MHEQQTADWLAAWRSGQVLGPEGPLRVVREHETHTAWVFLTDTHAFKWRKPVDLGFLNYSTIDLRRVAANTEVTIGQRISSQVHLGVWSLSNSDRPQLSSSTADGEPIVAMVRLADELQLEMLFSNSSTPAERIDEVALACAHFHSTCPEDRRADGYGALANTLSAWTVNFEQMPSSDTTIPISAAERQQLIEQTKDWFENLRPILTQRISEGRIREGHGDLRLQHVYLSRPWSVIDPLEFSIELRFCDVAAEVCFLAMELDDLGRFGAAKRLLVKYADALQDSTLEAVVPFFKRYRAVVRAKIEWIRAAQTTGSDKQAHLTASRRLFELALSYQSSAR